MSGLRDIKEAMRRLELDCERARKALVDALRPAGAPHDPDAALPSLIESAEAAVSRFAGAETLRPKARERRADLSRAEARLKAATDEDARWRASWRQSLVEQRAHGRGLRDRNRSGAASSEGARRPSSGAQGLRRSRPPHRGDGARPAAFRGGGRARRRRRSAWRGTTMRRASPMRSAPAWRKRARMSDAKTRRRRASRLRARNARLWSRRSPSTASSARR